MRRFLGTAFNLAFVFGQAPPTSTSFVIHESIKGPPPGFTRSQIDSLATQNLTLRVQLTHNNLAGLEEALYAVSTPGGEKYGQHLSAKDVASYISPSQETTSLVTAWLASNGLKGKTLYNAGDWVEFSVSVTKANEIFDTEFSTYEDASGNQFIRTLSYSIPSELEGHIGLVHPTVNFPVNAKLSVKTKDSPKLAPRDTVSDCAFGFHVLPICLQDLYSIPTAPANSTSNNLWVAGYSAEYADQSDVKTFIEHYRPDIPSSVNTTFNVIEVAGGMNSETPADAGLEAILDIEYTVGLATGVPVTFMTVGPNIGNQADEFLFQSILDAADFLVALETPPYVLTTSYGLDETLVTPVLANSICNAYMQLGARGMSILYSSGDGGVDGAQATQDCDGEPFIPVFPATCPYLTSVGATQLVVTLPETAASFSSGGFSNVFAQPSYQSSAVSSYLASLGSTYSGLYNASGRGFPDVSANGLNFVLFLGGVDDTIVFGTSCSSPTFASVIALVNDRLLSAGKSPLGFLNQFLYANPGALTDITSGDNPGCGTNGFNATTGWDPLTGLGTPNLTALVSAAGI